MSFGQCCGKPKFARVLRGDTGRHLKSEKRLLKIVPSSLLLYRYSNFIFVGLY